MVYISSDGKVYNNQPWSLSRVFSIFLGIFTAISLFLQSLIDPFTNSNGSTSSTGRRSFWGGSGGGGSGGGGGGGHDGRGPPRGPRRPMGRIMHLSDITVPGGCPGGSCGR
ncbi:glycine-rich selenoprotein-like [Sitodiplosis mosellana]|uniref:glycine-rich selenoprotein-like n=1 Tax=Sitodiplosis mosellana TaxID=263140 RepID=UPI002444543E|nr:glycine-rich selenoprotein-like [Sitodiplosis mosellana]